MIELLVTVVIAGVVFAAMVPFFANALNRTSEDELRVDGTNIAQDRIEQIRLLDYTDITAGNLNYSQSDARSETAASAPATRMVGESGRTRHVHGHTGLRPGRTPQKVVTVRVSRPGSSFVTTAETIIDPQAGGLTSRTRSP